MGDDTIHPAITAVASDPERAALLQLLVELCNEVIDVIKKCGDNGAPAGPMYAAMMSHGMSLHQFEEMMSMIVASGRVRKSGHVYYYVEKGQSHG